MRTFRLGLGLWRIGCAFGIALGIRGARAVAVDQNGRGEQGGKEEDAYDEAGGLGGCPLVCHVRWGVLCNGKYWCAGVTHGHDVIQLGRSMLLRELMCPKFADVVLRHWSLVTLTASNFSLLRNLPTPFELFTLRTMLGRACVHARRKCLHWRDFRVYLPVSGTWWLQPIIRFGFALAIFLVDSTGVTWGTEIEMPITSFCFLSLATSHISFYHVGLFSRTMTDPARLRRTVSLVEMREQRVYPSFTGLQTLFYGPSLNEVNIALPFQNNVARKISYDQCVYMYLKNIMVLRLPQPALSAPPPPKAHSNHFLKLFRSYHVLNHR